MFKFMFTCILLVGASYGAPADQCDVRIPHTQVQCVDMKQPSPEHKDVKKCEGIDPVTKTCEFVSCLYETQGLANANGSLVTEKLTEEFTKFGAENPTWLEAIDKVKSECLMKTLPPQGVLLNCPVYDFRICSQHVLLKNSPETSWKTSVPECKALYDHVKNCPTCPDECRSGNNPEGSCNACKQN